MRNGRIASKRGTESRLSVFRLSQNIMIYKTGRKIVLRVLGVHPFC